MTATGEAVKEARLDAAAEAEAASAAEAAAALGWAGTAVEEE